MPVEQSQVLSEKQGQSKISVIIVTYNAGKTLQTCLNSIFNQKYAAIEIVIIDGGSTDSTVQLLKENCVEIAYWKSEKDDGVYYAMNKALEHISGEWVYFLGADDTLLPGFSDMAATLRDASAIYYANVMADGFKRLGQLTRYQFAKSGPYHQAIIYPKAVFDKYRFDTRYKISADFGLTHRLCGDKAFHFIYKDYVIADFNPYGLSGTEIDWVFQKDKARLIWENFGLKLWIRYRIRKLKNKNNPRV